MQQSCIHFLNEMVMLFTIERVCNCEMIHNKHVFIIFSEKSMTQIWCGMQQSHPNQLSSLFVVCFHSFPSTYVSSGGY